MTLQQLLCGDYSLSDVRRFLHSGVISQRTYDWFALIWAWSCPRFGEFAAHLQERGYDRLPRDVYWRRFERMKALAEPSQPGCGLSAFIF
jgi:hypothetical protein